MSKTIKEERLRWIRPIINKELKIVDIVKICPYSERSLKRWLTSFRELGEKGLEPKSTQPKTSPLETPIRIKEEIISLRKKTELCAKKLHWRLQRTKNLSVPVSTIGKILKQAGLTRKYRKKKVKYKYVRAKRRPGELVEIDVKHVPDPVLGRKYYQYTAIDTASRWRHLSVYDEECTFHSVKFLKEVRRRFPFRILAIKTDNHSTFTNYYLGTNKRSDLTVKAIHALDRYCAEKNIVHYLIDKGKPAQNGTVERSHREDQEKFYERNVFKSIQGLKRKIRSWNNYYNDLEHCGLDGKTPNEMLELINRKVPKEVS
ncbi:MAG: DDE-type integrase/transposase/recombinase [Patescibacteria group bacterium]|nr:DDE-type integrase/transposase/recombinase [Patescibacteria group bacterium]